MKHISILVPRGHTSLTNIEGTHQILNEVNTILASMSRPPAFNVQLIGLNKETKQRNDQFTIKPDALIGDVKHTDLIIIPAMHGDPKEALMLNKEFTPWIIQHYRAGTEVASLCIASFFLASTGLLKGKLCATHWRTANEFRAMFPDAKLVDDKIMTEDSGIYTSGGAYSYLNLILYLIEKFVGRDVAIIVAKSFMIDIDRHSQSPFIIFEGQKAHEDEPVRKMQDYIELNYTEKITVEQLALKFAIGRRNLERRFKKATSNTITEYIQRVKIEAAKKSLEQTRENINEVMYKVGYNDNKAFRTVFKRVTGLSPIEYRNKYNRDVAA